MGHLVFVILHLVALLFAALLLLLTIPLHLIYAVMRARSSQGRQAAEAARLERALQVQCPDCRELVRWDARKCKHCGAELTPQAAAPAVPPSPDEGKVLAIVIALVIGTIFLVRSCA